jgi:anti-anti-sigma regulatory factor
MQVEQFDEFILIRFAKPFDEKEMPACLQSLEEFAANGEAQIYLDLGQANALSRASVEQLAERVTAIKAQHKFDILLICDPHLANQLNESPLGSVMQIFERRNDSARRMFTQQTVEQSETQLRARLDAVLDDAIKTAMMRWAGHPPNQIKPASASVNPATHVVSVVTMIIDGFSFRVFLSGSMGTLRGMVEQILKEKIKESDPAILDGACELLNYLTAFFKQRLTSDNSVVETVAPQLLQPDEMMVILNRDLPAQRVGTEHGSFDVWLEAAA